MRTLSPSWRLLGIGLGTLLVPACGGGAGGGSSSRFEIVEASNGFGKLLPYQINELDENGAETGEVVELTRIDQLIANASLANPVLPPTEWPVNAVLPNSLAGNQFVFVRFSQAIDPTTVLSKSSGDAPGTLGDGIQIQMVD